MNPVRDDNATTTCGICADTFERKGRQRYCSTACRQTAWRRQHAAPVSPVVTKSDVVYECPSCDARYLSEQRCDDCNTWCRRLAPGGNCPHCSEPVAITDLLDPDSFKPKPSTRAPIKKR